MYHYYYKVTFNLQIVSWSFNIDAVYKTLKKYAFRVGLGDVVHPHLMRHQLATELLRNKKQDITLVAEILGHSSLNTTMIYTKTTEEEKANAVEDLFLFD